MLLQASAAWLACSGATALATASPSSIIVDLGYTRQQGSLQDTGTFKYYNFTNVRYAAPAVGDNRFETAKTPEANETLQQAGPYAIQCRQALPAWLSLFGQPVGNLTDIPPVTADDLPPPQPGESEDCLFLDILAPQRVMGQTSGASSRSRDGCRPRRTAVLLFIHGGGYVTGSKTFFGQGVGLMETAAAHGIDLVFVSINYRLGLFGWLAGADKDNIRPNLGLLDQRFALEWVQKHIHLFGGDAKSVTVMGESAGGTSIMYHLTARDVSWPSLFSRSIAQSPFILRHPESQQRQVLKQVLDAANATSAKDLKRMSGADLARVNGLVVGNARPYGTFAFGPADDGDFVDYPPETVSRSINNIGSSNSASAFMSGYNSDEGAVFASPFVNSTAAYEEYLKSLFPGIPKAALATITTELYPESHSSSDNDKYGYNDMLGRVVQTIGDALIVCSAYSINMAAQKRNASYAYQFSVPPGIHSDDLPYTFFDAQNPGANVNATLARIVQTYFTNLAATGQPSASNGAVPAFAPSHDLTLQNINSTNLGPLTKAELFHKRCEWWNQGHFRPQ